jgi:hypothetical protein
MRLSFVLLAGVLLAGCSSGAAEGGGEAGGGGADAAADVARDGTTVPDAADGSADSHAKGDGSGTGEGGGESGGLPAADAGCGWQDAGRTLDIAPGLSVCLPPVVCTSETCPPSLGACVNGACQFKNGYAGLQTLPEAWVTYYCELSTGGCHGVTQVQFPEVTAATISQSTGYPLCEGDDAGTGECVGIAASSPMVVGNSQVAIDPATGKEVTDWGLGLTEASGLCYELTGPGGVALVALTDRCGGYCKCNGSGYQECGPCVSAPDMSPNCACVGTEPGLFGQCCGNGCATTLQDCDWCASNNHPHFDLDTGTFNRICGTQAAQGSCKLASARFVRCMAPSAWPPP